jgi:hypothetical protein
MCACEVKYNDGLFAFEKARAHAAIAFIYIGLCRPLVSPAAAAASESHCQRLSFRCSLNAVCVECV